MAMLINYKYDKDHDYIVKSEISQNENQLDNNRKVVIYDRPLLNALREAILTDKSDYSALSGINPILNEIGRQSRDFSHGKDSPSIL